MKIRELIDILEKEDLEKPVLGQVVAKDGTAWNMQVGCGLIDRGAIIKLTHPELKTMPDVPETN